jgi:hypothetical protein
MEIESPGLARAGAEIEETVLCTARRAFSFPYPHVVFGGVEPSPRFRRPPAPDPGTRSP